MVVPYGDPSPTHYFKNAFDAGENGVGIAASSLTLGCDCLGEIRYLDADGRERRRRCRSPIPNAICIHEEDTGVLWRHIEWRTGEGEVRRGRRLVISSFSAIGNYDYGFFWYLHQDGTIALRGEAHRACSRPARSAPDERPRTACWSRPGSTRWSTSTTSTCASTSTSTGPRTRWSRSQPSRPRRARRTPTGTRSRSSAGRCARSREAQAPRRPGLGALVGDRQPAPAPPARRAGRLPAGAGRERAAVRRSLDAPVMKRAGVHRRAPLGDPLRPRRALRRRRVPEPASGRRRAARVDRGRPADRRSPIWSSGTRSATTTSRGPRTGR